MHDAILITGLKTQRIRRIKHAQYYDMQHLCPLMASDGEIFISEEAVKRRVVPITQFCYGRGKPDVYLAISHEVEDLLGVPFNIVLKERGEFAAECSRLRGEVARLKAVTLWRHLKAVVKGGWRACMGTKRPGPKVANK